MPTHEAELILSCKATGTAEVKKFNDAVAQADKAAEKLIDTLGKVDRGGKFGKLINTDFGKEKAEEMRKVIDSTKQLSASQNAILENLKREKDLTNATLAELQSAAAARKAYNAEMKLSAAQKNLDKEIAKGVNASKNKIQELRKEVERLRLEYAKAAQAEANANLKAFTAGKKSQGFNIPKGGIKEATTETKAFSAEMLAAKVAGRALGVELSGVSKELAQYAIIAKGAESALKIFIGVMEHSNEALKDRIYWMGQGISYDREKLESETALASKLKNTFETLRELNEKENLSSLDRLKVRNIVEETRDAFRLYGIQLDIVSGKIANLNEAEIQFSEAAKKREIDRLKNAIAGLKAQNEELVYESQGGDFVKNVDIATRMLIPSSNFFGDMRKKAVWQILDKYTGGAFSNAAKDRKKNLDEIAKLQEQLDRIQRINPTANIAARIRAENEKKLADIWRDQVALQEKLHSIEFAKLPDDKKLFEYNKQLIAYQRQLRKLIDTRRILTDDISIRGNERDQVAMRLNITQLQDKISGIENRILNERQRSFDTFAQSSEKYLFNRMSSEKQLAELRLKYEKKLAEYRATTDFKRKTEIAKDITELAQNITQMEQNATNQRQQQNKARLNIWQEMFNAGQGFRQTAQQSVNSYSLEAMQLQSRRVIKPENSQINILRSLSQTNEKGNEITAKISEDIRNLRSDLSQLANNLGVTTY